jgi:hypothetical protein
MGSWNLEAGLNHVGAYQVSGRPFASGSINCKLDARNLSDCEISFPYVTRWFKVINKDATNDCKVAFSLSGLTGSSNYFTVSARSGSAADLLPGAGLTGDSGVLELKVSSIWVSGSTNIDIVAGLTTITKGRTATTTGANWSGSSGVG